MRKDPCWYCGRPNMQDDCAACHGNPEGHDEDSGPCKECDGHGFYTNCDCPASQIDWRAAWENDEFINLDELMARPPEAS